MQNLALTVPILIIAVFFARSVAKRTGRFEIDRASQRIIVWGTAFGPALLLVMLAIQLLAQTTVVLPTNLGNLLTGSTPYEFVPPLLWGIIAIAFWMGAAQLKLPEPVATAELAPRSIFSFVPRRNFALIAILLMVILALTVAAGFASSPDPEGKLRLYELETEWGRFGAHIYGWYYSIPAMVSIGVLLLVLVLILRRIARPILGENRERDIAIRQFRSGIITWQAIAALTLHLSQILLSLAGTASLRGLSDDGRIVNWSQFYALMPMLFVLGYLALGVSLAVWSYTFWVGVRKPQAHRESFVAVNKEV